MSGWLNQLQSMLGQKTSSSGEQGLSKLLVPGALGGLAGLLVANKSSRKLLAKYGTGALLAGGSTCKYCPDVLWLRDKYRAMCADGGVISAGLNFPGELDSPYGGLYFYGGHTAEILTTAFGPDIISVKADVTAGNVIAVFKYASLGVCVNFAEVSEFHAALYGAKEVAVHSIDISTIYRQGFAKFVQGVLTRTPPEPYGTLLRPVQILNALVEAAQTGREAFVAPPLE